jgi:cyclomaltodextrinase
MAASHVPDPAHSAPDLQNMPRGSSDKRPGCSMSTNEPEHSTLANAVLWHQPRPPFAYPQQDERIRVRLRTWREDARQPTVEWCDRMGWIGPNVESPMRWLCDDARFRYWQADIVPREGRVRYVFRLDSSSSGQAPTWFGEAGLLPGRPGLSWPDGYFHWPYLHHQSLLDTPSWVRHAVGYEIFPDRFARGTPPVSREAANRWPGQPTRNALWGGDLRGIVDAAGYVSALGVNLVWLTPIFEAPSSHKYDTTDYGRIDPHFGDDELFARLVGEYRAHGIRLILDGVFNHSGAEFMPWLDVRQRGMDSPYWSWFDIQGRRPDPRQRNYRSFAQAAYMPRFMTGNPEVQAYLIEQAQRWMRMGIAGWRLDVADEVDTQFWRAFRREMRAITPDAYFVGEIAYNAARWLEGDQFDGVMNYPLRSAILRFVAATGKAPSAVARQQHQQSLDAAGFLNLLGELQSWYPGWATTASLNPLSTHDVPRFLTACGRDSARWRLGMICLMALEGIPLIYYGDEVGLEGADDPDCRRPMRWAPEEQNAEMLATTRSLIRLRHEWPALRASGLCPLTTGSPDVAAFIRGTTGIEEVAPTTCLPGAIAVVVLNRSGHPVPVEIDLAADAIRASPAWPVSTTCALDLLSEIRFTLDGQRLRAVVPPREALLLVPDP